MFFCVYHLLIFSQWTICLEYVVKRLFMFYLWSICEDFVMNYLSVNRSRRFCLWTIYEQLVCELFANILSVNNL